MAELSGTFWILILYDVSEEIRLDAVRSLIRAEPATREPSFTRPAPEYVRFERPPVIEPLEPITLETGETFRRRIKYFDYGVVSVDLAFDFEADWPGLIALSSRWIASPEVESRTLGLVRERIAPLRPALVKPYDDWANEDYSIIQLTRVRGSGDQPPEGRELVATHGAEIAQIVRGESCALSESETAEIVQSRLSYYPADLLVAGWMAALIYDTPADAAPILQLLEYANAQLLEFRHYDSVLTD